MPLELACRSCGSVLDRFYPWLPVMRQQPVIRYTLTRAVDIELRYRRALERPCPGCGARLDRGKFDVKVRRV